MSPQAIAFFRSQKEMLDHAHSHSFKFFFSFDTSNMGSKEFGCAKHIYDFILFYSSLKDDEKHFYELIKNEWYEFYDLDFKLTNDHDPNIFNNWTLFNWFENIRSEWIKYTDPSISPIYLKNKNEEVGFGCSTTQTHRVMNNPLLKPKWIILTASNSSKLSLHLINTNAVFDDNLTFKKFYSSFKTYFQTFKNQPFDIDWSVCSKHRNMRIIDSSKFGTIRPLKVWDEYHVGERMKLSTTFITNASNDDKLFDKLITEEHFTQTFTQDKIVKENKTVLTSVKDNDIQDLLNILSQDRCENYTDWLAVGMALKNGDYSIEEWKTWSKKSIKYDEDYLQKCWNNFNTRDDPVTLGTIHFLAKLDNETEYNKYIIEKYDINIDFTFTADVKIMIKQLPPNFYNEYIHNYDVIALKSNMMTGKTYVMPDLFQNFKKIIVVYHRKSLDEAIYNNWSEHNFQLYSTIHDYFIDTDTYPRTIIQADSLHRLRGKVDLLILDELESTHEHICGSNLLKNRNKVYNTLMSYIKNVEKIIICDANLKDETVDLFCPNKSIIKIENEYKSFYDRKLVVYQYYSVAITKLFTLIENGKKIAIPTNELKKAKTLYKLLKDKYPHLNILKIDKTNKFNGLEEWSDKDILIYTPTITAGISYNVKNHFDTIFGFFGARSTTCESSSQMFFRVRHPKDNEMYMFCTKNKEEPNKPIDDVSLNDWIDNIIQGGHNFFKKQSQEDSGIDIDRYNKKAKINRYYKIYRLYLKKRHLTEDYNMSYLVKLMKAHGILIKHEYVNLDKEDQTLLIDQFKKVEEEIKVEEAKEILDAKDIDKSQYKFLQTSTNELNKDEILSIKKYVIKETFDKKEIDLEFIKQNSTFVKQYKVYKQFKNLKKDDALALCRQLKEECYYTSLFENYETSKDFKGDLSESEYSSTTGDELSDEESTSFTKRFTQRKNKIKYKKSISRSIHQSIHYDTRYHKLEHVLNLFYLAGFETVGSKKKVELDYSKWRDYLVENEENIRGVFKCKYIDFRGELSSGMKKSIGMYVQAKLKEMLGINIKATSKEYKYYKTDLLFKV